MNPLLLISEFKEFSKNKSIERPTMIRILEDTFKALVRKNYGTDENVEMTIDLDHGKMEIYRLLTIVDDNSEDIWDPDKITLSDARKIEPDFEVDEQVAVEVKIEDFGRRMVQTAIQTLKQKVKDLEKESVFNEYKDRVGEIISGEVAQISGREIIVEDTTGIDLILPRANQIPKDRFHKGDTVRAIVEKVELVNGNPRVIISRTSPVFLERLFEQEVPEIYDGIISMRKVVREPGERAKVAVESYDDRVDPVGACVGMKGSRIHNIVRELENENIDVINYTTNLELFISRALSPAKISTMKIDEERKRVAVYLKPDQVSLAIGKNGHNINLASKLVAYEIDVFREPDAIQEEDDIDLQEFDDEIEDWVLEEFKRIGLDTARSVLSMSKEDLVRRTDLEEETILEVFDILKREFEQDEE
ncbi:MAG: transcription termination factor NusA [Flexibacteraceae bacterium]